MWQIGAAILGTAASLGIGALQKPKWKQHRPDLSFVNKYISNLRSDLSKRTVERNIMREGAQAVGDISRQQQYQTEYDAFRTGTAGTGVEAAQRLEITKGAQTAMAGVTQQAGQITAQRAEATMEQIRQAELHKDQVTAQAKADYDRAKSQWKREMWGTGLQGAVNIGMAGFQEAMQARDATAMAQAAGEYATPQEARAALKATGAPTWEGRLKALGISGDKEKERSFVTDMVNALGIASDPGVKAIIENQKYSSADTLRLVEATVAYNDIMKQNRLYEMYNEGGMSYQDLFDNALQFYPEDIGKAVGVTKNVMEASRFPAGLKLMDETSELYAKHTPAGFFDEETVATAGSIGLGKHVYDVTHDILKNYQDMSKAQQDAALDDLYKNVSAMVSQNFFGGDVGSFISYLEDNTIEGVGSLYDILPAADIDKLKTGVRTAGGYAQTQGDRTVKAVAERAGVVSEMNLLSSQMADAFDHQEALRARENKKMIPPNVRQDSIDTLSRIAEKFRKGEHLENLDVNLTEITELAMGLPEDVITYMFEDVQTMETYARTIRSSPWTSIGELSFLQGSMRSTYDKRRFFILLLKDMYLRMGSQAVQEGISTFDLIPSGTVEE